MAAIDKTYVDNYKDYKRAFNFLRDTKDQQKEEIGYLIPLYKWRKGSFRENDSLPIWNTSTLSDIWLSKNCDIDFVQKRIKEQYTDKNWIGYNKDLEFSELGFIANIINDDNISIHPFKDLDKGEIDIADNILVYGTTFFEQVWHEAESIVRGENYNINKLIHTMDFCIFGLSIEYRNGKYFINNKEIAYGYFPRYNFSKDYFSDKHFHFPKIKHSFKSSDMKKYKDFEIVLSLENQCFNKDCYTNHEKFNCKRLLLQLPEYIQTVIK